MKNVFLIDDSPDIQMLLSLFFENEGFNVISASNGEDALKILRATTQMPAVIFLDLMMPVMDGYQFREIQMNDPLIKPIPVVIMTADQHIDTKAKLLKVQDYIRKPIEVDELLRVAQKYCE